ncbi:MAG: hypothetical protein AAFN70_09050 [Planctomycetota bacterium]
MITIVNNHAAMDSAAATSIWIARGCPRIQEIPGNEAAVAPDPIGRISAA